MSLSDNTICCLCDKQHTSKQYLSETHMRHDPLQLAIYSKRQCLCQLGAYVIRKMTPSKTWLQFCASFCLWVPPPAHLLVLVFVGIFVVWDFGVGFLCFVFFSARLRSIWFLHDVLGQKKVTKTHKWEFLHRVGFYRSFGQPDLHRKLLILIIQGKKENIWLCALSLVASRKVLIYSLRKTTLHLLLVLGWLHSLLAKPHLFLSCCMFLLGDSFTVYWLGNQCDMPNQIASLDWDWSDHP